MLILKNVVSEGFIKYYKRMDFSVKKWTFNPNGFNDEIFKNEKKIIV